MRIGLGRFDGESFGVRAAGEIRMVRARLPIAADATSVDL